MVAAANMRAAPDLGVEQLHHPPGKRRTPRQLPAATHNAEFPDCLLTHPAAQSTGMSRPSVTSVDVLRVRGLDFTNEPDPVAVEEPLEIRLAWTDASGPREKVISVTMRTPGEDYDLAAGFLFTEGDVRSSESVESIRHWGGPNVVRVALREGCTFDASTIERHFYTTSSCGVCGKSSIEAVRIARPAALASRPPLSASLVHRLPALLQSTQEGFRSTGGLHGAAIIDRQGRLLTLREDVGRHNATDKAIGASFRTGATPLADAILMVSSRASFELVQKALVAGIPALAAIGAPTSLAIELARDAGMTLVAFVRDQRFNVYAGNIDPT